MVHKTIMADEKQAASTKAKATPSTKAEKPSPAASPASGNGEAIALSDGKATISVEAAGQNFVLEIELVDVNATIQQLQVKATHPSTQNTGALILNAAKEG